MADGFLNETFAAHYVMYSHDYVFEHSIASVYPHVDRILIARTRKPWFGDPIDLTQTDEILSRVMEKYGDKIDLYEQEFPDEQTQRNFLLDRSRARGDRGAFIVDCDEVFIGKVFRRFLALIERDHPKGIRGLYLTFVKDAGYCVAPPYEDNLFYVDVTCGARFSWARKFEAEQVSLESPEPEILHFSYLRRHDEDIRAKVRSFMHQGDADWETWIREVYDRFHPSLTNFHPVWPERWSGLKPFDGSRFPALLRSMLEADGKLTDRNSQEHERVLKLHLGCGPKILPGYVNVDLYDLHADVKANISDLHMFRDNTVDEIYMNAVFEHLYTFEQDAALREWFRVLKPAGRLRIDSTPDFDAVIDAYRRGATGNTRDRFDLEEVMRYTHGAYAADDKLGQIHKDIFTREKMRRLCERAGFTIVSVDSVCWKDEPHPVNINVIAEKPLLDEWNVRLDEAIRLRNDGDRQASRRLLESLLNAGFDPATVHNELGVLEFQDGRSDEALSHLEQAVALRPDLLSARKNLADLLLEQGDQYRALNLYHDVLKLDPTDVAALLGAGGIMLATGRVKIAIYDFRRVLELDPGNAVAQQILATLNTPAADQKAGPRSGGNTDSAGQSRAKQGSGRRSAASARPGVATHRAADTLSVAEDAPCPAVARETAPLQFERFHTLDDFRAWRGVREEEYRRRQQLEQSLAIDAESFGVPGHCHVCGRDVAFAVDYQYASGANGQRIPNWRERLVCPSCGLSNRLRSSIHAFRELAGARTDLDVFLTEQTTPLYRWFRDNYPRVTGSEFLGADAAPGTIDGRGVRNEDLTRLTFGTGSFDAILSFEVLEHIPDYRSALEEMARVLRPGGILLFSVPFAPLQQSHVVRARLNENGAVEHLLPPEYHGDPVNANGCLAFYHFGWQMLNDLAEAGFRESGILAYWSQEYGYLGGEQYLLYATV